jgi:two-component system LytT family response regulator
MIETLIVDDNEKASEILGKFIMRTPGFEISAKATSGEEALKLFGRLGPEVVFMDIELPGMTGVECAKRMLEINPDTYMVFSTAHDEYMGEAFEMYAFDYILKPFGLKRVKQTLERIASLLEKETGNQDETGLDKLLIKNRDGMSFIDIDEIMLVFREGNRTKIVTSGESYLTSINLNEVEERLDGESFMRTHKSYIVNLKYITRILPYGRWTHIVKLKGIREDALITHEKLQMLEQLL